MDLYNRRPQRPVAKQNVQRFSQPAEQINHKQPVLPQNIAFSASGQNASFANVALTSQKPIDFSAGAKAYKRRQFAYSIVRGFMIASVIALIIATILGSFGFILNKKYYGKALPFSYIGDISVGGMTQAQIKDTLDSRAKAIDVKFVDGALIKTMPLSSFGVKFDTDAVSKQAATNGFSPFAYLNRKRLEVPVTVNERQIDGYLRLNIYNTQTKSENAVLYKEKNKLAIKPEVMGFRSDPSFIANRIKIALSTMSEPIINVNAVTVKPNILKSDLEDDLAKANKMLATDITIKASWLNQKITNEQKMSWLQLNEAPGTKNLNIAFNKSMIRQYVNELAVKYQVIPKAETTVATVKDDGAVANVMLKGTKADNVDEVADNIYKALTTGTNTNQTISYKNVLTEPQKQGYKPASSVANTNNNKSTIITPVAASTWR